MKKRLLLGILVLAGLVGFFFIDDPLRTLTEFIIAGVVPGLNISLGLFPSLGVTLFVFWLLRRWLRSIRLEMLAHTASQIGKEKVKSDFMARNSGEPKTARSSSVIAPSVETLN